MTYSTRLRAFVALGIMLPALTGAADAALIVRDYKTAGDGLLTYDTRTGLEWLDLSQSLNTRPGSTATANPGFRFASRAEATSLFVSAGFDPDRFRTDRIVLDQRDTDAGLVLRDTIGVTGSAFEGRSLFFTARFLTDDPTRYGYFDVDIRPPRTDGRPFGSGVRVFGNANPLTAFQSNHSDFIVRNGAPQAVPEPAAWALMIAGFGLAGTGLRRAKPGIFFA